LNGSKRILSFAIRLAFTIVLLWLVVRNVDFRQIEEGWKHHLGPALLASLLLLLFALALSALRWMIVSKIVAVELDLKSASAIVLVGHFFSQLLPTSFGGDAMRGWMLWRRGASASGSVMSVLFDRIVGMSALLLLVLAGLPFLASRLQSAAPLLLAGLIVIGGGVGVIVLFNTHRFPETLKRLRHWSFVEKLAETMRMLLREPLHLSAALALSLGIHASALYTTAIVSDALGANLSMLDALLIVPTVLVVSSLPVSIGGWGVREAGLAGGFTLLGLPPSVAVATSVLFGVVNIAGGVVGGVVYAVMGSPLPLITDDAS
jgi:uncharacterized protein (TIRG00374 family)